MSRVAFWCSATSSSWWKKYSKCSYFTAVNWIIRIHGPLLTALHQPTWSSFGSGDKKSFNICSCNTCCPFRPCLLKMLFLSFWWGLMISQSCGKNKWKRKDQIISVAHFKPSYCSCQILLGLSRLNLVSHLPTILLAFLGLYNLSSTHMFLLLGR